MWSGAGGVGVAAQLIDRAAFYLTQTAQRVRASVPLFFSRFFQHRTVKTCRCVKYERKRASTAGVLSRHQVGGGLAAAVRRSHTSSILTSEY